MPRGSKILGKPIDEEKWERAKARAAESGHAEDYAVIMDIYKKMTHSGEFTETNIAYRKKKKMKVPAWRKKFKYSPKKFATATKSGIDTTGELGYSKNRGMRLILAKAKVNLDEFRCGACGALLFKGRHLHKSFIEVKCRSCRTLNVNQD